MSVSGIGGPSWPDPRQTFPSHSGFNEVKDTFDYVLHIFQTAPGYPNIEIPFDQWNTILYKLDRLTNDVKGLPREIRDQIKDWSDWIQSLVNYEPQPSKNVNIMKDVLGSICDRLEGLLEELKPGTRPPPG